MAPGATDGDEDARSLELCVALVRVRLCFLGFFFVFRVFGFGRWLVWGLAGVVGQFDMASNPFWKWGGC